MSQPLVGGLMLRILVFRTCFVLLLLFQTVTKAGDDDGLAPKAASRRATPDNIPDDVWPDSGAPLLKIHPDFNQPKHIAERAKLAGTWKTHTPLAYAVYQDDPALARWLLRRGADPNEMVDARGLNTPPVSPLRAAIARESVEAVRFLLAIGASPREEHNEPLSAVARRPYSSKSQTDITRLLLEYGADPSNNDVLLNTFAWTTPPEAFELLLKNGATIINKADKNRVPPTLHTAIRSPEHIRIALRYGADPNVRSHGDEQTALHECARRGFTESAKTLIDAGAEVNASNGYGETPVEIAISKSGFFTFGGGVNLEFVKTLLAAGAGSSCASDVAVGDIAALIDRKNAGEEIVGLPPVKRAYGDWVNESRGDLISIAIAFGQGDTVAWLLENGIRETRYEYPTSDGTERMDTPALVVAAFHGHETAVKALLKHGTDPNETTSQSRFVGAGVSPLHAVIMGAGGPDWFTFDAKRRPVRLTDERRRIIRILVQHGARVDQPDGDAHLTMRELGKLVAPGEQLFPDDE